MDAHTPGPWTAEQEDRHGHITIQTEHDPVSIAYLAKQDPQMDGGRDFAMERANGRLLAAAPELLTAAVAVREALRQVTTLANINAETRSMLIVCGNSLNDVIAKARGQA